LNILFKLYITRKSISTHAGHPQLFTFNPTYLSYRWSISWLEWPIFNFISYLHSHSEKTFVTPYIWILKFAYMGAPTMS